MKPRKPTVLEVVEQKPTYLRVAASDGRTYFVIRETFRGKERFVCGYWGTGTRDSETKIAWGHLPAAVRATAVKAGFDWKG